MQFFVCDCKAPPDFTDIGYSRRKSSTILTIFGLVISLVYTTGSGSFILTIADAFLNNMALILGVILQAVIFGWMYGVDKLLPKINENSKIKAANNNIQKR